VADGVGGWADLGVDPGLYSKKLCSIMKELFSSCSHKYIANPQLLIEEAVRKNTETGTSTISVVTLDPSTGQLRTAYLGDSVFSVFRNNKETFSAPEQQHSFNQPYQVGTKGNHPTLANKLEFGASAGDFLVMGSDGLWDNLHKYELKSMLAQKGMALKNIAERIANTSFRYSQAKNYASPFYEKAKKAKFNVQMEGKEDDISVIVASVEVSSA
jgi:protein phosphatase PTC7